MPRTKGATNKQLRKDARLSRWAVLQVLTPMLGAYVTAKQIKEALPLEIGETAIKKALLALIADGTLKREGKHADKRGYIYLYPSHHDNQD